jgi:hypothetical protein
MPAFAGMTAERHRTAKFQTKVVMAGLVPAMYVSGGWRK